ncbi:hypothetical protein FN846DRAFT_909679 [Sphaerosporella brunnea]|uniref:RRM domain-containing protein n=1 Tax=Sphaerosporella brunnea TaxID=1250544 RepID=A0A5J5EQ14_9PEZI|nr:hypothetical protein FN846DRAFT_909679 [Sphaerosporella brunnea]
MSENQLSPLHTNPPVTPPPATDSAIDVQIQQESRVFPSDIGIERRQILSPVSPHPVHVQEPPVLKNQMELANNFTDAHPTNTNGMGPSSAATFVSPDLSSLESLMKQHQQQALQQQQHHQHQEKDQQPPTLEQSTTQEHPQNQLSLPEPTLYSASSSLPSAIAPFPAMDKSSPPPVSSSLHAGNGEAPAGNGSFASSASAPSSNGITAPSKPTNISTGLPPPPILASNLSSSNVDLQALLTKLSSPATPTVPQQLHSAPQSPPLPNGAPVVAPSSSAPPPSVKSPLPQSPVQKTRTSSNPPPPPTNHPLPPVPVVSSSLPGQPPAGYPASLPPPPNFAQHKQQQQQPPPQPQQPASVTEEEDEEDSRPFTVDEEEEFSQFLTDERDYVSHGQWDRFPPGSRLFIGNLPTEKVTKRDLFRIFHKHGRLAQVSIKQAYGFVQFLDQSSCAAALRHEQGSTVRGRKMHLEISKPQRNTRPAPIDSARTRRSRSPDYSRGGVSPRRGGPPSSAGGGRREVDRYRGPPASDRDSRDRRDRDEYASRRRSSPPPRARDDYRPGRRSRSRSRSPPARYRPRSRSRTPDFDDVPLPKRSADQVPEVQILVSDELDRNFIWWVENAFRSKNLKCDMLFLNPRLQLSAVVKRQVMEGVNAVVFLNRQMQLASTISIQIFDRKDQDAASFNQYDNLDPSVAAELVVHSKQQQQQYAAAVAAPAAHYGSYGAPPAMQQPQVPQQQQLAGLQGLASVPGLASLIQGVDAGTLQKILLGLHQQSQPQIQQQPQYQQTQQLNDLASMLARPQQQQYGSAPQQPQQQAYGSQPPPQNSALGAFGGTAGFAALLGQAQQKVAAAQQQQSPTQQSPPQQPVQTQNSQIGNIMETLAKWKQS